MVCGVFGFGATCGSVQGLHLVLSWILGVQVLVCIGLDACQDFNLGQLNARQLPPFLVLQSLDQVLPVGLKSV